MTKLETLEKEVEELKVLVDKLTGVVNNNADKVVEVDSNMDLVVRKLKQQGINL